MARYEKLSAVIRMRLQPLNMPVFSFLFVGVREEK